MGKSGTKRSKQEEARKQESKPNDGDGYVHFHCVDLIEKDQIVRSSCPHKNMGLNTAAGFSVEGVLVLHCPGPPSPVGVVIVLRCSTGGLQQALRAVAPAL